MRIDKKLILCSILAIAIGIAVIAPLGYLMGAESQNYEKRNEEILAIKPWFKVSIPYASCDPYKSAGNFSTIMDGAMIQIVANFTVTSDALKDTDAQIEYYQFTVSSDEEPIANLGYYVLLEKGCATVGASANGTIWFANGLIYNGPLSNGGQCLNYDVLDRNFTIGFVSSYIFGANKDLPEEVTALRRAQTLCIDVTKICTVTIRGNITITTAASKELLCHIELPKIGDYFVYGNNLEGTLPFPIEAP